MCQRQNQNTISIPHGTIKTTRQRTKLGFYVISIPHGTIKTNLFKLIGLAVISFQFHMVRLRRLEACGLPLASSVFQFHMVRLRLY